MNQIINSCLTALNNIGSGFCSYAAGIFVQSSVLIVLLLIVDFLLRKRVRAVFRYCVWMLVFVKLILPPTLCLPTGIGYWCGDYLSTDSPVLVLNSVEGSQQVPDEIQQKPDKAAATAYLASGFTGGSNETDFTMPTPAVPVLNALTWQAFVFLLWLVGVLVFSVLLIQRISFVKGLIAQSEPSDERLPDMLNQCRRQVGIRRDIELRLSSNISGPAVCGLFKPVILIPIALVEKLSPDKLRAVLIHELVHIKRADIWVNLVQTVLQIIYFYNPFVWLANAVVRRIREQAVDEMVLVSLGAGAKNYSNTLIDIAEMAFWKTSLTLRLIGVVESKKALQRRIRHMLNRPIPKNARVGVLGTIVIIVIAAVLLPMAKAQKSETAETSVNIGADTGERTVDKGEVAVATAKPEPTTTLRKLREEWGGFASLSADGKYMCDVDWDTGDLVVREFATGKQRSVTNKGSWEDSKEYALDSAISPDSKRVAYLWYDPNSGNSNLYTIGLDGSGRKLLRTNEYLIPRDWSSDGKRILGILLGKPKEMVWVSSSDGSIQRIKAVGKGYPGKFDVSPDGRYIAYDLPQEEGSTKRDIFLFAIDENREIPLVQHPANDRLLGWTPDGKHVFFASDRMGSWDGWLLNIAGGKPKGLPELVKPEMGDVQPIGFTPKGDYYFGIYYNRYNVYTAMLDLQTGKDLSAFKTIGYTGTENLPDWSPDGRYLAYCTGLRDDQVIRIRSLATGRERELDPNLPFFNGLRWSPDGRSLLASDFRGDEGLPQVIYKVDAQTGEHTSLSQTQKGEIRQTGLSPDGRSLFYEREGGIVVKDLETGREKEIFRAMPPMQLRDWALSPDGQRLVFGLGGTKGSTLKIISATGGEPRELLGETWAEGIREFEISAVTWMSDSRSVLFRMKWQGEKGGELWWISAEGGEPRKLWVSKKVFGRLRVHPDGQHIAFSQHDLIYELWVMENFLPAGKVASR